MNSRLLDRVGTDPAVVEFLKSDAQQHMFDVRLNDLGPRVPPPYMRMLTAVQISFMLLSAGGGLLYIREYMLGDGREAFLFLGTLGRRAWRGRPALGARRLRGRAALERPEQRTRDDEKLRRLILTTSSFVDALVTERISRLPMTEPAFLEFYARTAGRLNGYLRKLTGDASLAEDLLQEAYLRFLTRSRVLDDDEHQKNYLFRIATNLARDHFRREQFRLRQAQSTVPPAGKSRRAGSPTTAAKSGRSCAALVPRSRAAAARLRRGHDAQGNQPGHRLDAREPEAVPFPRAPAVCRRADVRRSRTRFAQGSEVKS